MAAGRPVIAAGRATSGSYGFNVANATTRQRFQIPAAQPTVADLRFLFGGNFLGEGSNFNATQLKVGLEVLVPVGVLSGPLATGTPITSLPTNPLPAAVAASTSLYLASAGLTAITTWNGATVTASSGSVQQFVGSGSAAASSLTVTSQTPNFAYPAGTVVYAPATFPTTFGGRQTGVLDPNATLLSDPVAAVEMIAGQYGYLRVYQNTPVFPLTSTNYSTLAALTTTSQSTFTTNAVLNPTAGQVLVFDSGGNLETVTLAANQNPGTTPPYTYQLTANFTKGHASGATFGQYTQANIILYSDLAEGFSSGADHAWDSTAIATVAVNVSTTIVGNPSAGATSFQTAGSPALGPTSQLTLNSGGGDQETVTVTDILGTGNPYTIMISGTLANSHVAAEAVLSTITFNNGVAPLAIVADRVSGGSALPAVVAFGCDSIVQGTGSSRLGQSFFTIAFDGLRAWINAAKSGEAAYQFINPNVSAMRRKVLTLGQWAFCEDGTNDIYVNQSAAQIQASNLAIWTAASLRGLKVAATTILPRTASTDSWTTATNQTANTANGGNVSRVTYNDWLRAGAPIQNGVPVAVGTVGALLMGQTGHPLTLVVDTCSVVEVNSSNVLTTDGGLWLGQALPLTADGLHPSPVGHSLLATAVPVASFV